MRLKKLTEVTHLFVTATMTPPSEELDAAALRRVHRHQGYSDIAVHYVIDRKGVPHAGRARDLPGCLAGTARNMSCLQVALVGGVDGDTRAPADNFTEGQRASLLALADELGLPLVLDPSIPLKQL